MKNQLIYHKHSSVKFQRNWMVYQWESGWWSYMDFHSITGPSHYTKRCSHKSNPFSFHSRLHKTTCQLRLYAGLDEKRFFVEAAEVWLGWRNKLFGKFLINSDISFLSHFLSLLTTFPISQISLIHAPQDSKITERMLECVLLRIKTRAHRRYDTWLNVRIFRRPNAKYNFFYQNHRDKN